MNRFKKLIIPLSAACVALSVVMLVHSLSGEAIVGCGVGSGCSDVMGSRWGYFLGSVPVSLPSATVYLVLLLCVSFVGGKSSDSKSLDKLLWPLMLVVAGGIAGCAVWFCWLQIGVLHAFCKYCTLLHLLGCLSAVVIVLNAPCKRFPYLLTGLAGAAMFVMLQVKTAPEYVYNEGMTEVSLPVFSSEEMYSLGLEDSQVEINLLFDFQCVHCRRMHPMLEEAAARAGVRIVLCPVPLSNGCNPYIPDGIDRFKGSCELTRLALAVWFTRPDLYSEYERWLMDGEECPSLEAAQDMAEELVGREFFDAMAGDERIAAYLRKACELFGRTSNAAGSGIPRFVTDQKWVVPEVDSVEGLVEIIGNLI